MSTEPQTPDGTTDTTDAGDLEFIVEDLPEGGLVARSFGACILTEADGLDELADQIREAVCCHFNDNCSPKRIRLRFVRVVHEETLEI